MADDDRTLAIAFEAKLDRMEKQVDAGLKKVVGKLEKMEKDGKKSFDRLDNSGRAAFANLGKYAAAYLTFQGIKQFVSAIEGAAKRFDELGDTASRLGTSAGDLVKWQHALEDTSGSLESFIPAAEAFQGVIGKFVGGIGKVKGIGDALAILGISRADMANAKTLQERLLLIADAIGKVDDRAVRAAIADKLGIRPLLPLLEQGSTKIAELTGRFDAMGVAVDEGVRLTGDMADKLVHLKAELQYKEDNLFIRLLPVMEGFYNVLIKIADEAKRLSGSLGLIERTHVEALESRMKELNDLRDMAKKDAFGGVAHLSLFGDQPTGYYDLEYLDAAILTQTRLIEEAKKAAEALKGVAQPTGEGGGGKPFEPVSTGLTDIEKAAKKAADEAERLQDKLESLRIDANNTVRRGFLDMVEDAKGQLGEGVERQSFLDREIQDAADKARSEFKDAFVGALEALESGDVMGFIEGFANQLKRKAYEALSDAVFDALSGKGSDGIVGFLSSLLGIGGGGGSSMPSGGGLAFGGSSWATGGYTGGGSPNQIAGAVHRGEYVFDAAATQRIGVPNLERMRSGGGGGSVSINIDARGMTQETYPIFARRIDRLERSLTSFAAGEGDRIRATVAKVRQTGQGQPGGARL